jgi:hypothetical protein
MDPEFGSRRPKTHTDPDPQHWCCVSGLIYVLFCTPIFTAGLVPVLFITASQDAGIDFTIQDFGWDFVLWMRFSLVVRAPDCPCRVLGSISASYDTVESEGRQMKQCWKQYTEKKTKKSPCLIQDWCNFWIGKVLYSTLLYLPSIPPQIILCRRMLGSNPGLLRLWHWLTVKCFKHSARSHPQIPYIIPCSVGTMPVINLLNTVPYLMFKESFM